MLFDTHAHLDSGQYQDDREEVIARARDAGVGLICNVGYDLPSSRRSIAIARDHEGIYAAVGVHPHDASTLDEGALDALRSLAGDPRVVAIGEIGLDYYRDLSPRKVQKEAFRRQIALARQLKLPIIIHDRDAHQDVMAVLREEGARNAGGIFHCFSGDAAMARECLELGFHIALGGPVTFSNGGRAQEVARVVPPDRLLVETDCPYLAPAPYRGRRNEPAYVRLVAEKIAALRGLDPEELAAGTTENALRLFRSVLFFDNWNQKG